MVSQTAEDRVHRVPKPTARRRCSRVAPKAKLHRRAALARQRANKCLRLLGRNKPRPVTHAFDPHQAVGARNVHLDDSSSLCPEPPESAPQTAGPHAYAPADFLPKFVLADEADIENVPAQYLPALERPDHFDRVWMHDKATWAEPKPDPGVDRNQQQAGYHERRFSRRGVPEKYQRENQKAKRERKDCWGHPRQPKATVYRGASRVPKRIVGSPIGLGPGCCTQRRLGPRSVGFTRSISA